jgi:hypothetical protein
VFPGYLNALLHQLLCQAPAPGLVGHRYNPTLQDAVHVKGVEQVEVPAHRVQNCEYLVEFRVGRLLDLLNGLFNVAGS